MKALLQEAIKDISIKRGRQADVCLLGLGTTNRAALDLLLSLEGVGSITACHPGLLKGDIPDTVRTVSSADAFDKVDGDIIIPSPSVRRERLSLKDGAVYLTDYDLLFKSQPRKLFSVSGSDGKSTTVAMSSQLLSKSFPYLFTGGNLGTPLWKTDTDRAFLLELSSFTLRYSQPQGGRALLTSVTPNHLDWHEDLTEYEKTKLSLLASASEPILNLSDAFSEKAARGVYAFALVSRDLTHSEILKRYRTEHTVTVDGAAILLDGEEVVKLSEVRLKEKHNILNLALAIALSIGYADREHIREVSKSFEGLGERCESFTLDGVRYISSSIDTTPTRTQTTLKSLDTRVRIILGGRGKGLSPEPLRGVLKEYAERIAIYGEIADELSSFINSDGDLRQIQHRAFGDFLSAVEYACDGAITGDTVLLSPAATSYGEFKDYTERGRCFKEYAKSLHGKSN